MRQFKVSKEGKEKTVTLTESDYNQLLKRYDTSKARLHEDANPPYKRYLISISCLCLRFRSCADCPLTLKWKDEGMRGMWTCHEVLKNLGLRLDHVVLLDRTLSWTVENDYEARQEVTKVRNDLLGLPRLRSVRN